MFWLSIGVILGIWLDQTFTIPPLQDIVSELSKQYKKHQTQKT